MKIYLVRHGESIFSGNDNKRPLSHQGRNDILNLANFIKPLNIVVKEILQSKKLRAKETAEILAPCIQHGAIQTNENLDPDSDPQIWFQQLNHQNEDLMLVGHMPFMGKLVALMISGFSDKNIVAMKTGTMICLEKIENEWIISWMVNSDCL
jgi:phosphohistidine phosphatase